jgi:phosphate transport system permease protein
MCSAAVRTHVHAEHGGGARAPETAEAVRPAVGRIRRGKRFWRQGEPFVWATGAALAAVLLLTVVLIAEVLWNGLGTFWPAAIAQVEFTDGRIVLGQWMREDVHPDTQVRSVQLKTANRELDPERLDFHWYDQATIRRQSYPPDVFVLERLENGNFHGMLERLQTPSLDLPAAADLVRQFDAAWAAVHRRRAAELGPLTAELAALTHRLQDQRQAILVLEYRQKQAHSTGAAPAVAAAETRLQELRDQEEGVKRQSDELVRQKQEQERALRENVARFRDAAGQTHAIALLDIVRAYQPNAMGLAAKTGHYASKLKELLWDEPRESNTEGGLFPAIFGTVMLVFLMSVSCFPLGVLAGVYLGEYAREGLLVRIVRIAVNNLAGIPSIVYGIFGLGFFVYGVGSTLDRWLYPELVAASVPTWGTGGVLWASLTLGLLTVPVVIVSTEEALRTIPRAFRESSHALGATKLQTLVRVLLPMASPGIMTGFILAMARAAGEVAPLMITGVVKIAPTLALDGEFPFFHADRKFMHLGFHIFDIAFQSPNVEASKPMVFVTTTLLVLIVLVMSSSAIYLRNSMRKRFTSRSI